MDPFTRFTGLAMAMDMADVDTDQIIPKQHLKLTHRKGYGQFLFANWRYDMGGAPQADFVLNQKRFEGAKVLVAGPNFGSGSSREHAVWALMDYGLRCVIAPSFAPIFKGNAMANGLLCVELPGQLNDEFLKRVLANEGYTIRVDLVGQTVTGSDKFAASFEIGPDHKRSLVEGLDAIGRILEHKSAIAGYEAGHDRPWQAAMPEREQA